jgi:8-oxo-dGTP pyrophosphatase MutT (NUDIX family)
MFKKVSKLIKNDSLNRFVGTIVIKDGDKVLLGKKKETDLLVIPGGHVQEDEAFFDAAVRETKEETGIEPTKVEELYHDVFKDEEGAKQLKIYYTKDFKGKETDTDELENVKFVKIDKIPIHELCNYAKENIKNLILRVLDRKEYTDILKELSNGEELDPLAKQDVTYGDALNIVGTKTFCYLDEKIDNESEDMQNIPVTPEISINIRKHGDDNYSGNISKTGYDRKMLNFTNMPLVLVNIAILSVLEWKMPKGLTKEEITDMFTGKNIKNIMNSHLDIDKEYSIKEYVEEGSSLLMDRYKEEQMVEIKNQMNLIRDSLKNDSAVDLRSLETRLMKLFDRLEETVKESERKIIEIESNSRNWYNILEAKLLELKNKLLELDKKPVKAKLEKTQVNPEEVLKKDYFFLSKPKLMKNDEERNIEFEFDSDWDYPNIKSFLNDIKGKILELKRGE